MTSCKVATKDQLQEVPIPSGHEQCVRMVKQTCVHSLWARSLVGHERACRQRPLKPRLFCQCTSCSTGKQNGTCRARNRSVCLHQGLVDSCAGGAERTDLNAVQGARHCVPHLRHTSRSERPCVDQHGKYKLVK